MTDKQFRRLLNAVIINAGLTCWVGAFAVDHRFTSSLFGIMAAALLIGAIFGRVRD